MNNIKIENPDYDMQQKHPVPSDNTIAMIENLFVSHSGFKKSEMLRRKIKRVIEGRSEEQVLEWLNQMMIHRDHNEMAALSEDLTNNETYFFRDIVQFECLEKELLPQLIKNKKKSKDKVIRLWSAACSTGEEAYSLAIIALEYMLKNDMASWNNEVGSIRFHDGWSLKVFGTDISRQVIKIARNGIYSSRGLSPFRDFPAKYYGYFQSQMISSYAQEASDEQTYQVKDAIKNLVYFEKHNLMSNEVPLMLKNMDVVFCRNMFIYIEAEAQKNIQKRFQQALSPHGYLVMSPVDNIHDAKLFSSLRIADNIIYQRR